jgi:hypothetical protein
MPRHYHLDPHASIHLSDVGPTLSAATSAWWDPHVRPCQIFWTNQILPSILILTKFPIFSDKSVCQRLTLNVDGFLSRHNQTFDVDENEHTVTPDILWRSFCDEPLDDQNSSPQCNRWRILAYTWRKWFVKKYIFLCSALEDNYAWLVPENLFD